MRKLLIALFALLAGCGAIVHPGDGEAAAEACKPYSELWWFTTTSKYVRADRGYWLNIVCRDQTEISILRGGR